MFRIIPRTTGQSDAATKGMFKVTMTAFPPAIHEPRRFKVRDELTYFSRHKENDITMILFVNF